MEQRVLLVLAVILLVGETWAIPDWFLQHRIHGHTRLSIISYCSNSSKWSPRNGSWVCKPLFENAANLYAQANVPAFVRHTHTGKEGTWWPSTTDPKEAWHPMIQQTGRNLPLEFLRKAAASKIRVIFYHYMKCSEYYAQAQPTWVQRWPDGRAIQWKRGIGLSPCSVAWQKTYISQILQLVAMGADAFYFDEFPASQGGDWSEACKSRFKERFGDEMPTEIRSAHTPQPWALDRRVQLLMTEVTQEYFTRLTSAIKKANPNAVALVSVYAVPRADNGYISPQRLRGLYETTQLLEGSNSVAKTEFEIGMKTSGVFGGDTFDRDVFGSYGYTMTRDAAGKWRPPHIWIPFLTSPQNAVCSSSALVAYGAIANPDHPHDEPDQKLFNTTYQLQSLLYQRVFRDFGTRLRPSPWVRILHPEQSRNRFMFNQSVCIWDVLFPMVGAWNSMIQNGVSAGLMMDWQLTSDVFHHQETVPRSKNQNKFATNTTQEEVLLVPPQNLLDKVTLAGLEQWRNAAPLQHRVVSLQGMDQQEWNSSSLRPKLGMELFENLTAMIGFPGVQMLSSSRTGAPPLRVHLITYELQAASNTDEKNKTFFVFVTNNFTHCDEAPRGTPIPPPISENAVISVYPNNLRIGATSLRGAYDALSGSSSKGERMSAREVETGRWLIKLSKPISTLLVVRLELEE